ncbi:50S ribosomal protein L18 [Candidatus Gracilibacteria bacterium]|nr:50S ribosomal protein L18 [Candidatus Gracilibacteria bacterium]
MTSHKLVSRSARARRTHAQTRASGNPRLVVFRSNRTVYAQIVDPSGTVLCGASGLKMKSSGAKAAEEVGTAIAELAQKKKIKTVAFDRSGYKYHGQIKSLAEAARKGGLSF